MHLDIPIEGMQRNSIVSYVRNPNAVAKHSFLPLIRRSIHTYPYRTKCGVRKCRHKTRPLTYASHVDSAIFAYYAYKLQSRYEAYLVRKDIGDVVTAYRRIKNDKHGGNKCSIDFAYEAFQKIRQRLSADGQVAVLTFDIQSFFDSLNHRLLKRNWKRILGVEELPSDEYAVYKNVVEYSYVDDLAAFKLFQNKIVCKDNCGNVVNRKVNNKAFLRDKSALAYCLKSDIREIRKQGLIRTHRKEGRKNVGIPQGLPISSVLANIYMMDFDLEVKSKMEEHDAFYRRYSDDIIIICPADKGNSIKTWIQEKIKDVNLEIQESKTNLFELKKTDTGIVCEHSSMGTKKRLEYLGFSFDGNTVLLKKSSIGKYYYKMHKNIGRTVHYACMMRNATRGTIFERRLITRFTKAGSRQHRIYKRARTRKCFYTLPAMKTYGNYFTYVEKSAEIMNEPKIRRQLRRSANKLSKCIKDAKNKVALYLIYKG